LVDGDVTDISSITEIIGDFKPDMFFHLAAQSHVGKSWKYPVATSEITGMGTLNCLEAVRIASPKTRFYFAGSSEQFGNVSDGSFMLNENSPMQPESPYAVAKLFGFHMTRTYRRSYGMHASNGILFNHSSPLRGEEFVTRKITMGLSRIKRGLQEYIELGNLDSKRDWGHAKDAVRAMYLMLMQPEPDDYVIATGKTYSVRDFLIEACNYFELDPDNVVRINKDLLRPKDVNVLIGDASKAKERLGWSPTIDFKQLVHGMCDYDNLYCHPDQYERALAEEYI
jgi:GDPmannose 4,6-dehydratase